MDFPVRLFSSLLLVFFPMISNGFPNGRVEKACKSMIPEHVVDSQTSNSPYSLEVSSANHTGILGFRVTLRKSDSASDFRGFMIQARAPGSDTPQGTFIVNPGSTDIQTLTCTTDASAVTHTSPAPKSNISVIWLPPKNALTKIQFRATAVQSRNIFWTDILSEVFPLAGAGTQLMAPSFSHLLLCCTALIYVLCRTN